MHVWQIAVGNLTGVSCCLHHSTYVNRPDQDPPHKVGNRVTCPVCGEKYTIEHMQQKYCSALCRRIFTDEQRRKGPRGYKARVCQHCEKEFLPRSSLAKFCSVDCKRKFRYLKERKSNG